MSTILFSRAIGPVPVDVVLKEQHGSKLSITKNAIETGAKVTDHAYVENKTLSMEIGAADAVATYNALVRFQESRVPFTYVSGLFVYKNLLIAEIDVERDSKHGRVLKGTVSLEEIRIVETARAASDNKDKDKNSKTKSSDPSKDKSKDATTKDKTSGPVNRGDSGTNTVLGEKTNTSIASRLFNGSPTTGGSSSP